MNPLLREITAGTITRSVQAERRGVEAEVRLLVDDVLGDDWTLALRSLRLLEEQYLPWLERRSVRRARAAGSSWASIARAMSRSRQAVRQRFLPGEDAPTLDESLPPRLPVPDATRDHQAFAERIADLRRRREMDDAAATGSLVAW